MPSPLSRRHREVMRFVQREIARTSEAPTLQQIADACGLSSKSRAHAVVAGLIDSGFLARTIARTRQANRGLIILKHLPDDRFEDAARAACAALQCVPSPDNIKTARDAIFAALVPQEA